MKTTTTMLCRMVLCGALLLSAAVAGAQGQKKAEAKAKASPAEKKQAAAPKGDAQSLYERARFTETSKGNLGEAADLYRAVLADPKAHPEVVMQARFQLATCMLKQGDEAGARRVLKQLVNNLPSRESLLAKVEGDSGKQPAGAVLEEALAQIAEMSLEPIDRDELTRMVLEGIAGKLGKYSQYFSPADLESFYIGIQNKLVGIGAVLSFGEDNDSVVIQRVLPESPAERAKLKEGDEILAVNDQLISAFDGKMNEIVHQIRGKAGTKVTLKITRADSDETKNVVVERQPIELKDNAPVAAPFASDAGEPQFIVDPVHGIAALRLRFFAEGLAEQLRKQIVDLQAAGMKALVIDLRNNGGGMLNESIDASDLFVGDKLILHTESRSHGTKEFRGKEEGTLEPFPVVLLINGQTASAAEIFAACLQDHGIAVVMGQRSLGKGTVETLMRLSNGGALKLSVSEYFRPSGKGLRRPESDAEAAASADWGVRPDEGFTIAGSDIEVKKDDAEPDDRARFANDPVWQKALEHLRSELEK